EPFPAAEGPVQVIAMISARRVPAQVPGAQRRRHGDEQRVGNRVLVWPGPAVWHRSGAGTVRLPVVLAPVDSSAPVGIPGAGHILEYIPGGGKIIRIAGQVVSVNPGERPPAFIIVVAVGEAGVEGTAGREKRLGQEPVSLYWPVRAWSPREHVLYHGCQVG